MIFRLLLASTFIVHSIAAPSKCLAGGMKASASAAKFTPYFFTTTYAATIGNGGAFCAVYIMWSSNEINVNYRLENMLWCGQQESSITNFANKKKIVVCKSNPNHVALFCNSDDNCNGPALMKQLNNMSPQEKANNMMYDDGSSASSSVDSVSRILHDVTSRTFCSFTHHVAKPGEAGMQNFWDHGSRNSPMTQAGGHSYDCQNGAGPYVSPTNPQGLGPNPGPNLPNPGPNHPGPNPNPSPRSPGPGPNPTVGSGSTGSGSDTTQDPNKSLEVNKNSSEGAEKEKSWFSKYWWVFVIVGLLLLLIIAGIIAFILIMLRRKQKQQEGDGETGAPTTTPMSKTTTPTKTNSSTRTTSVTNSGTGSRTRSVNTGSRSKTLNTCDTANLRKAGSTKMGGSKLKKSKMKHSRKANTRTCNTAKLRR